MIANQRIDDHDRSVTAGQKVIDRIAPSAYLDDGRAVAKEVRGEYVPAPEGLCAQVLPFLPRWFDDDGVRPPEEPHGLVRHLICRFDRAVVSLTDSNEAEPRALIDQIDQLAIRPPAQVIDDVPDARAGIVRVVDRDERARSEERPVRVEVAQTGSERMIRVDVQVVDPDSVRLEELLRGVLRGLNDDLDVGVAIDRKSVG